MKTKKVKTYTYAGLGFPIELKNVKMLQINDEWHPQINVKKVAAATMKVLLSQQERFTGNQIKFIRQYFSMSLRDFAKDVVNESHTAVSKWEKCGNEVTNMDINIEKVLRLYMHEKLSMKTAKQKSEFYKHYLKLKQLCATDRRVSRIQIASC